MPETVAVQITADRVVLARAQGGPDGAEIVELISREVATGEDVQRLAMDLVRERGIENIGLVVGANWDQYSLRDVWLPFTGENQIRSTIKFELEDDFEADADQLLMPFQLLETRPDASHILAWVATKETIGTTLRAWESAGLSPEYMPPDAVGHLGLVAKLTPELAGQPIVAVSGDEHSVHLTLLQGQTIWARRRLLNFSWATEAAGRPLQEIRRTFLNVPSFPAPVAVVSFGGEPADVLASVIARDLGCQHRVISPPQLPDGSRFFDWPLAAGLALFIAQSSERPLSFRREEFEPKETAQVVSLLSVVATALLGVVFLVGGLWCLIESRNVNRTSQLIDSYATTYWQQVFAGEKQQPKRPAMENLSTALNTRIKDLQKVEKALRDQPDAIKRFAQLAARMKNTPASIDVGLARVEIKSDRIDLSGTAADVKAVTDFQQHLSESPDLVADVRESTIRDGKTNFIITISYRDKLTKKP